MPTNTRSDQRGSRVSGHQAGRNVIINAAECEPHLMKTLIEMYKNELSKDSAFNQFIDSLQHYINKMPGDKVKNLKDKLKISGREDKIEEAESLKELFAKKLMKNRFSESAQHILSYILGRAYFLFQQNIRPMIENNKSNGEVDHAIYKEVIEVIFEELDENVLLMNYQEIIGVVYYLAGNCHVKWH